jgi:hypothetical protein
MILPFKIPLSLQIMDDEYIVKNDAATTSMHMHLEKYYTIN